MEEQDLMQIERDSNDELDMAALATVVTALLIRLGGKAELTPKEWTDAIEHKGSMFILRSSKEDPVSVMLMQQVHHD